MVTQNFLRFVATLLTIVLLHEPRLIADDIGITGKTYSTPLIRSGNYNILVPCLIAGEHCTMVLDTGCGTTLISEEFARRMKIDLAVDHSTRFLSITGSEIDGVKWGVLPSFKVGDMLIEKYRVATGGWSGLLRTPVKESNCDLPCIGVLGSDFFRRYNAVIDYRNNVLTFSSQQPPDSTLLAGRWRSVAAERRGVAKLSPGQGTLSHVEFDARGLMHFTGPAPGEQYRVWGNIETDKNPKVLAGFVFPNAGLDSQPTPGFAFFHYVVKSDQLVLVRRNVDAKLPKFVGMTTANDPDAVMYYYVRIGSVPDEFGRTAAEYIPWTRFLKRFGVALDGPYRVGNFDYSLNRDLTVTAVEVSGPTTITWDLGGSRIVRRGPRATLAR